MIKSGKPSRNAFNHATATTLDATAYSTHRQSFLDPSDRPSRSIQQRTMAAFDFWYRRRRTQRHRREGEVRVKRVGSVRPIWGFSDPRELILAGEDEFRGGLLVEEGSGAEDLCQFI